jgi:hypothetical protein
MREERVLLHLDERTRRAIDPGDVYFLEADGSDTQVRLRTSRRGELPALWRAFGERG